MRLFFALWPDERVRAALALTAAECRDRCRGRPIPPANLHATLAFLGEVEPFRLSALVDLAERIALESFEVALDRLGYFRRSRIVYAGPSCVPPPLLALAAAYASALAAGGFRVDERAYAPHVTLLRDARAAPPAAEMAPLLWRVRHIVLVESVRDRDGPVYRPLRRFMLDS